jgi:preprotein translocase subunit SecG
MYTVLIVIHAIVTFSLIGIILVQRNSGDMGLSASSSTSFMSGRAAANFLTRATAILATIFILLSLGIGILTAHNHVRSGSIVDRVITKPELPKTAPSETPAKPTVPRPE